jgi:hypothetical protein
MELNCVVVVVDDGGDFFECQSHLVAGGLCEDTLVVWGNNNFSRLRRTLQCDVSYLRAMNSIMNIYVSLYTVIQYSGVYIRMEFKEPLF